MERVGYFVALGCLNAGMNKGKCFHSSVKIVDTVCTIDIADTCGSSETKV